MEYQNFEGDIVPKTIHNVTHDVGLYVPFFPQTTISTAHTIMGANSNSALAGNGDVVGKRIFPDKSSLPEPTREEIRQTETNGIKCKVCSPIATDQPDDSQVSMTHGNWIPVATRLNDIGIHVPI